MATDDGIVMCVVKTSINMVDATFMAVLRAMPDQIRNCTVPSMLQRKFLGQEDTYKKAFEKWNELTAATPEQYRYWPSWLPFNTTFETFCREWNQLKFLEAVYIPVEKSNTTRDHNIWQKYSMLQDAGTEWRHSHILHSQEDHVAQRHMNDQMNFRPREAMQILNAIDKDVTMGPFLPKFLKMEDFGWAGNPVDRPMANRVRWSRPVAFADNDQFERYMSRFTNQDSRFFKTFTP